MKQYVVLDTNVIVSALFATRTNNLTSSPFLVLNKIFNKKNKITPLYNDEIIEEYKEVLGREKFNFHPVRIGKFINDFKKIAINIENLPEIKEKLIFPDPKDVVFYQVTLSTKQNYLVTGNISHFPVKPFIVTPYEYLKILEGKKISEIRQSQTDSNGIGGRQN